MRVDSVLSVKDACGRQVNLLNDQPVTFPVYPSRSAHSAHPSHPIYPASAVDSHPEVAVAIRNPKSKASEPGRRRYHCPERGCNKSFTTSGHLARHNRIHKGEKNFQCVYPGCPSRFSRQDNMMQHYRTHMSPKSRRNHRKAPLAAVRQHHTLPVPQGHAHIALDNQPALNPLMLVRPVQPHGHDASSFYLPQPMSGQSFVLPKPRPLEPASTLQVRNRPHRASSVSSTSSSSSSVSSCLFSSPTLSPPSPERMTSYLPHLPPPKALIQNVDGSKPLPTSPDLLQLAHIVTIFG